MRAALILAAPILALLLASCSDDEPEPTAEERLEAIEGQSLSTSEVEQRLEVAATLCRLDEAILDQIWQRLDEDQMAFQDFVFDYECPERSTFYAGLTGRYVTDEARNSGIVTSTTVEDSTTSQQTVPAVPNVGTVSPSERNPETTQEGTQQGSQQPEASRTPSARGTVTSQVATS